MIGQRPHVDLNEIDAVIPPFSGEDHYDIVKWFNQFEDYAQMCEYGEKEKCLGLRRRLTGAAKNYVFNLGAVGYLELKANIIKLFKRTVTRQEVYRQLQARKLQSSETALSYLISMQTIAGQSSIDEQELVDFIIDGIPDTGSHVTFLYGAHTMDELIRRLDRFEQKRRHAAAAQKKTTSNNKTSPPVQPNTVRIPEDSIWFRHFGVLVLIG
ncbi:hypothetical protein CVS40_11828 [Lucilia cuprina]|nr:hypothetical protein CVS40_11828 [Lucilia cuprina]